MARFLALLCFLIHIFPLNLQAKEPIQQISKWTTGKRIQVMCTNGDKLVGRLGRVTSHGFTLDPDKKGMGSPREITFAEVRSLKTKRTSGENWLLAGLIYAGVTALFAATLGN
jgi:hypothetical protein